MPSVSSKDSASRPRPRRQPIRRFSLWLVGLGVSTEMVSIVGMVFGILAGVSFLLTSEPDTPFFVWLIGMGFCLLRVLCIRFDQLLQGSIPRQGSDDNYFTELPERVSDAVTLIGFGFAADANPWLGLIAALAAIFSAYVRSVGTALGMGRKSSNSGPMTRIHRLLLLALTSLLMALGVPNDTLQTPIPQIALWVIILGCITTVMVRWRNVLEPERK